MRKAGLGAPCKKLPDSETVALFFLVTWITYFSIYLGRLNFSAGMSDMVAGGFLKSELGFVAAAFYLSYGAGQLLSGVLGDRYSPRILVFIGLLGTSAVNLCFPLVRETGAMATLWFLNGLAQALIWAPLVRLTADRTDGTQCVRMILLLSTTGPAGMLCAYAMSAALIQVGGWQMSFWVAGLIMLAVSALWFVAIGKLERLADRTGYLSEPPKQELASETGNGGARGAWVRMAVVSGLGLLLLAACLHGVLKDGLTTWIPTYLTETFQVTPSFSVALTMILPVVNLSGVFLAGRLNQKWFGNEAKTALWFFVLAGAAILCMIFFGDASIFVSVLLFAVVTSAIVAINTLFISIVPIHFRSRGMVSTVSGALNAITYGGSAVASGLFGLTAEAMGWTGTRILWCAIAVLGAGFCLLALRSWGRFRQDIYRDT